MESERVGIHVRGQSERGGVTTSGLAPDRGAMKRISKDKTTTHPRLFDLPPPRRLLAVVHALDEVVHVRRTRLAVNRVSHATLEVEVELKTPADNGEVGAMSDPERRERVPRVTGCAPSNGQLGC